MTKTVAKAKTQTKKSEYPIRTWSISRVHDYEKCPFKAHLKYVAKVELTPEQRTRLMQYAERGSMIHDSAEQFVDGRSDKIIPELKHFATELEALRSMYKEGKVTCEEEWALDRNWQPTAWVGPDTWVRLKLDVCVRLSETEMLIIDYKGLSLTTEIPTPAGFTTMGELQVGDEVFDAKGNVCTVVGKSQVHNRACHKVTFDDTSHVICDDVHQWTLHDGSVVPVTALKRADKIRVCEPVQYDEQALPIDPYVLGLWLADGKHTSGEITKADNFVFDECERRGYALGNNLYANNDKHCRCHTVKGIRKHLTALGVRENKHIPEQYLHASVQQRLDLLRGLMDGDGSANTTRKQVVFSSTNRTLSLQVRELACSLGQRATMHASKATGFGVETTVYPVTWRPQHGINPFLTPIKAAKANSFGPGNSWYRKVTAVEPIASVPTQCIVVDSEDHTFLCTRKYIPTHNSGKKFGNEIKHNEQGQLYAIGAQAYHPEVDTLYVEFWYTDQDDMTQVEYGHKHLAQFKRTLYVRGNRMTTATQFPARPNIFNCRYCEYNLNGTGHCELGVIAAPQPRKPK